MLLQLYFTSYDEIKVLPPKRHWRQLPYIACMYLGCRAEFKPPMVFSWFNPQQAILDDIFLHSQHAMQQNWRWRYCDPWSDSLLIVVASFSENLSAHGPEDCHVSRWELTCILSIMKMTLQLAKAGSFPVEKGKRSIVRYHIGIIWHSITWAWPAQRKSFDGNCWFDCCLERWID